MKSKIIISEKRREQIRRAMQKWRNKSIAEHKCIQCGKDVRYRGRGYVPHRCPECLKDMRQRSKRYYNQAILKGLCPSCGKKRDGNYIYCSKCRARAKPKTAERIAAIRSKVLTAYGNKCACCGELNERFLTIDHINNDGEKHRERIKKTALYQWLVKHNFPEGFQILCWNCNMGKKFNHGVCPHKTLDALINSGYSRLK